MGQGLSEGPRRQDGQGWQNLRRAGWRPSWERSLVQQKAPRQERNQGGGQNDIRRILCGLRQVKSGWHSRSWGGRFRDLGLCPTIRKHPSWSRRATGLDRFVQRQNEV